MCYPLGVRKEEIIREGDQIIGRIERLSDIEWVPYGADGKRLIASYQNCGRRRDALAKIVAERREKA